MKPRPIIEYQDFAACPALDSGGRLEIKNSLKCLRIGDTVERTEDRKFRVTRCWWPSPFGKPWDETLYPSA